MVIEALNFRTPGSGPSSSTAPQLPKDTLFLNNLAITGSRVAESDPILIKITQSTRSSGRRGWTPSGLLISRFNGALIGPSGASLDAQPKQPKAIKKRTSFRQIAMMNRLQVRNTAPASLLLLRPRPARRLVIIERFLRCCPFSHIPNRRAESFRACGRVWTKPGQDGCDWRRLESRVTYEVASFRGPVAGPINEGPPTGAPKPRNFSRICLNALESSPGDRAAKESH